MFHAFLSLPARLFRLAAAKAGWRPGAAPIHPRAASYQAAATVRCGSYPDAASLQIGGHYILFINDCKKQVDRIDKTERKTGICKN